MVESRTLLRPKTILIEAKLVLRQSSMRGSA
jgi:hypothetical protein